jgi:drug/metabolite transporter (DMT)-like permease
MQRPAGLAMTPATWTMLIVLAAFWGCTFFFNAIALPELPPASLVALRAGFAAVILWPILLLRGEAVPINRSELGGLALLGLFNCTIPFLLIVWGQTRITGGIAAVLVAMTPIFTVLVAHLMTKDERITPARLSGVSAGLLGVIVLIGPQALLTLGADLAAQLGVLAATISYAWSGVYARRFIGDGLPLLALATWQITFAALFTVPLALVVDQPWALPMPGPAAWGAVAGLTLTSTVIAYMLYFRILSTAGATNLLLVNFLVPLSAILLGFFVLGEDVSPRHFAGMALIALGLACLDGRLWRLLFGWRR